MAEVSRLGRYELRRILGRGAMGVVYEGLDPTLGRKVAVKTILKTTLLDEETERTYSARFIQEAKAAARLNHPNIVQVYDFGVEDGVAYLVMEFIEGRELRSFFESREKFPAAETVRIMGELLDALDFAHEAGVIHRDVKPANVMLDVQRRTKLADFGVARIQEDGQRTKADTMVGTPAFMSPEQIFGHRIDRRTDIFSAGNILYQLLTGEKPFKGDGAWSVLRAITQDDPARPSTVEPSIPPLFDQIVGKALAKNPDERYASARQFAAELREALGSPIPATSLQQAKAERRTVEAEVEFWRSIQNSNDPEEFRVYIDEFPDGTYSQLARLKLARLRAQTDATPAKPDVESDTTLVQPRTSVPSPPPPVAPRKSIAPFAAIAAVVATAGAVGAYLALDKGTNPAADVKVAPVTKAEPPAIVAAPVDVSAIQRETEERVRKELLEKSAMEQAAAAKVATERAAAEQAAVERAAARAAADKAAQEKAFAEKLLAEKALVEKAWAEKAAAEKAAVEKKLAEQLAAQRAADERIATERAKARLAAAKAAEAKAVEARSADAAEKLAADKAASARAADTRAYANEDQDWGVSPPSQPQRRPLHAPTPVSLPGGKVVKTIALKHLLDTDRSVVVVDVLESRERNTVPGAYWLPGAGQAYFYGAERERFAQVLQKLTGGNKDRPLVFLCLNSQCWLSFNASLHALEVGYRNVTWYRGGTDAWIGAGYARKRVERTDW